LRHMTCVALVVDRDEEVDHSWQSARCVVVLSDKLTQIATSRVNRDAPMDAGSDKELASQHAGPGRTKKR